MWGSADRKDSLEGRNTGWLLGDEIRFWPRESYDRAISRVRVSGANYPIIAMTTTPDMGWIHTEFANREDRVVIHGATEENEENLLPGYKERLRATLSPGLFKSYVLGQWVSTAGSVFQEEYDEEVCVDALELVEHEPVLVGMDPGVKSPAVVFCQRLPYCAQHHARDCLHILGELVPDETPLVRLLPMIQDKAARNGWRLSTIFLDPFGGNAREQVYGSTVAEKLEERGYVVEFSYDPQSTNVLNGIDIVRSRLLNAQGERRLFLDRSLVESAKSQRNIARALASYHWPERRAGAAVKNNPVHDETSHVMDALRYVCVNLFPLSSPCLVI